MQQRLVPFRPQEIGHGRFEGVNAFEEHSNPCVTPVAQDPSHPAGIVVMVDTEVGSVRLANSTNSALFCKHLIVRINSEAMLAKALLSIPEWI